MARTKEFEPDRVLERAMDLFWRQGYEATSVQELLDEMGIGRGSLYGTFGDKHQLFLAALDRYREEAEVSETATLEEGSPKEAIESFFVGMVGVLARQEEPRRGCLIVNSAVELATYDQDVKKRIHLYVTRLSDAFEHALLHAQHLNEVDDSEDPATLAHFLVNNTFGLRVLARAGAGRETLENASRTTLAILKKE